VGYIGAGITRFNTADDLTVTDDAQILDELTVNGNVTLGDAAGDAVTIAGTANVQSSMTVDSGVANTNIYSDHMNVTADTLIQGALETSGTLKLDGNYPVADRNVALGDGALDDGSLSGNNNTAIGAEALTDNTSGASNTATGKFALQSNTTADNNTAIGNNALQDNTTGSNNIKHNS